MKIEQEETVGLEDPPQFEDEMFSPMSQPYDQMAGQDIVKMVFEEI